MNDTPFTRAAVAAASLLLLAGAPGAVAGQDPAAGWSAEEAPADTVRGPGAPALGHWRAETWLSGVVDSNANRDDDEITAPGVVVGGRVGVQSHAVRPVLRAEYMLALHSYRENERWDRLAQRARVVHTLRPGGRLTLETTVDASTGLITLEHPRTDQLSVVPRLEYRPDRTHRFQLEGGWRARRYDDDLRSTAVGGLAGVDYRYRVRSWQYAELAYRYEENRAELERRSYGRSTLTAAYTHPLTARDRLRVRAAFRDVHYHGRALDVGGVERSTRDRSFVPAAVWIHDFARPVRAEIEYRALVRRSTDPGREFDAHRALVTLRYRW
jgi:hypothetical protein